MKELILGSIAFSLVACGSGGGSDSSSSDASSDDQNTITDCIIVMSTISLDSGETCNLTESNAALFGNSAGEVSCDAGELTCNNNIKGSETLDIE